MQGGWIEQTVLRMGATDVHGNRITGVQQSSPGGSLRPYSLLILDRFGLSPIHTEHVDLEKWPECQSYHAMLFVNAVVLQGSDHGNNAAKRSHFKHHSEACCEHSVVFGGTGGR